MTKEVVRHLSNLSIIFVAKKKVTLRSRDVGIFYGILYDILAFMVNSFSTRIPRQFNGKRLVFSTNCVEKTGHP
jgi:hypothetical protein